MTIVDPRKQEVRGEPADGRLRALPIRLLRLPRGRAQLSPVPAGHDLRGGRRPTMAFTANSSAENFRKRSNKILRLALVHALKVAATSMKDMGGGNVGR